MITLQNGISMLAGLVPVGAISGGLILVVVLVIAGLGAAYGMKTRKGSGINRHPGPDSSNPNVPDPDEVADTEEEKESILDQRGTK